MKLSLRNIDEMISNKLKYKHLDAWTFVVFPVFIEPIKKGFESEQWIIHFVKMLPSRN